ncbi:MAG TPA: hypothetical protein H9746_00530 [Candidatus Butyricicoccus avistercoris]|uniref:Uncharacterized protein n=1 Tax=Candidatus Butyricicoccus avistercoris TaxID=2838518 RepID=A0A9D1PHR6_9FIRM|nr:hypothetical protein [Candidatus Butyricicoccus avistercoris]
MSVRSLGYDSENLDTIICYFMKTILELEKNGVLNLPLENTLVEPYKTFLDTAMEIFMRSPSPELAHLILDAEYDCILSNGHFSTETILGLKLIKEFTFHIHYDADYYEYFLATENMWGLDAIEFAHLNFYPYLSEDIKSKHHII